ncbi:hypothetical protein PIB30_101672 [Stylosanthes scabra]|uniref:Uncharacterized protein n=1 Tax=Stylosanthes scabra TaxID=79078 RepID=A0ABU6UWG5_9FABA|nr:hypothetical protein [Stylosanthes scabra]
MVRTKQAGKRTRVDPDAPPAPPRLSQMPVESWFEEDDQITAYQERLSRMEILVQYPNEAESCMRIDVIDSLIQDAIEEENSSNIEELLQAEIEEKHQEEASESLPTKPEKIVEDK